MEVLGSGRYYGGFGEQVAGPEIVTAGPVWHISVRALTETLAWFIAVLELKGYGDRSLGEWREVGHGIMHLRRRLSAEEEKLVEPLRDIRNTPEERTRLQTLFREAPHLRTLFR